MTPLIMTEEFWATSPFSIVRHTGQIHAFDHLYRIVNKEGKDIFQCSKEADKMGREKAIEPGEPCDLCRYDLIPAYRKLGRERIFALIREGKDADEIKAIAKATKKATKTNKV